ncbi:MAG: hypothetical protein AB1696_12545 [Planctomycetota bacterium]
MKTITELTRETQVFRQVDVLVAAAVVFGALAFARALAADELLAGKGYRLVGAVKPRHAREIAASNWSVGAETMDRNYTIYAHWKDYLGPLGAKAARVQSGWPKTEKEKGKYDWAWLDEIIPDMVAQGVKPWVCLCYSNPIYEPVRGWAVPTTPAALDAWDRYVAAVVQRYGRYVNQWEIWNEPASPSEEYADFVARTARVIRGVQSDAHIIAAAWRDTRAILERLKQHDALGLVNEFTYHPYTYNPDDTYRKTTPKLRELLASYAPHFTLRQGENGAPSKPGSSGAIAKYDWTEEKQAKWALRRLLGDLGRDIPSSYFSICDMHYPKGTNYKGLLATNDDKTVHHAKPAYYAVQRVTAIFDNTVRRIADFAGAAEGGAKESTFSLFGFRTDSGSNIVTLWRDSNRPGERPDVEYVAITLPGMQFSRPVLVDMLTGGVYEIPDSLRIPKDGAAIFRDVPAYDSVVLIAERSAVPLSPAEK